MDLKSAKISGFSFVMFLGIIFIGFCLVRVMYDASLDADFRINSSWTIEINSQKIEKVHLTEFVFPKIKKGDKIIASCEMPNIEIDYPFLQIRIKNVIVKAYKGSITEENCIYSYGEDLIKNFGFVPKSTCYVPVDTFSEGEKIFFVLEACKNIPFKIFSPPKIMAATDKISSYVEKNWIMFIITPFLIVFGVLGGILGISSLFLRKNVLQFVAIAMLSFWGGFSLVCFNDFIELFSKNFIFNSFCKYIVLSCFSISLLALICIENTYSEQQKKVVKYSIYTFLAIMLVSIILQFTNVFPPQTLSVILVICNVIILFLGIFITIKGLIREKITTPIAAFGIVAFYTFTLIDFLAYFFYLYLSGSAACVENLGFGIGILSIIFCSIANYIHSLNDYSYEAAEKKFLHENSYIDCITGAFNRSKTIETLKQFDEMGSEYTIIYIEVQNISDKDFDTIKLVSLLIKRVFGCYGLVGRIDSTTFVVVAVNILKQKIIQLLFVLQELVMMENDKKENTIQLNVGYSFSNEIENADYNEVYQAAKNSAEKTSEKYVKTSVNNASTETEALPNKSAATTLPS